MISICICMIVKNEEKFLARCLDCLQGIGDEIIIVDTGSTDRTKEIAYRYTDKVYDYAWSHDFAAARNFSFSKATKDYIYSADADEIIDEANRQRFMLLKQVLLPEIDIVQMKYGNQLEHGTVYNFDIEYRGKLFKRLREFRWIDPVHETVDAETHVYESDIMITHMPDDSHAPRDFSIFVHAISGGKPLSPRLYKLYARELFKAGTNADLLNAYSYYHQTLETDESRGLDERKAGQCIVARCSRLQGDDVTFFKTTLKNMIGTPSAEVCCELGDYYWDKADYQEAAIWYYTAANGAESELDIRCTGDIPLRKIALCYEKMGDYAEYRHYLQLADEWTLPEALSAEPQI